MQADVLIAGTGVAGLYCALNLRKDLRVLVISKSEVRSTNTYLAQGGISTAVDKEDVELFIEDTIKAGGYENKLSAVSILAEESIDNIKELIHLGLELDTESSGLSYTREGAHSINRIVHCKDQTGKAVAETLIEEVRKRDNIELWENTALVDILKRDNRCTGAVLIRDGKRINMYTKSVVMATGGIGGLFKDSTNQRELTGDGLSIALKNNIKLKDLNYIQFHPTGFYTGENGKRRFLISESLRGEGAKLYNFRGKRFVNELLPRDKVTEAITKELQISYKPYVDLDISYLDSEYIKTRFPAIYAECLKHHIDITREPIPVSPTQHYFMGGIEVNLKAETSMENLYAVGETACTGVHGANRLASNSLLEGLVFSKRAANTINDKVNYLDFNLSGDCCSIEIDKHALIKEFKRSSGKLYDELFCS
ncbi:MAG: L-aspartate oxidase [Solirubrobacterales bacterium]